MFLRIGLFFVLIGGIGVHLGLTIQQPKSRLLPIKYGQKLSTTVTFDAAARYDISMQWDAKAVRQLPPVNTEQAVVDVTVTSEEPRMNEHFSASPAFYVLPSGEVVISSSDYLVLNTKANRRYWITISAPAKFEDLNRYHPQIEIAPHYTEITNRMWLSVLSLSLGILCLFGGFLALSAVGLTSFRSKRRSI